MQQPLFITGNVNKVKYLELWLGLPIEHHKLDLTEIQSLDLQEVVTHKAREAYRHVKRPVLIEDVALTFHVLGRLPGTLIRWFLEELGNEGLCRLLDGYNDRSATAQLMYGLYDGRTMHYFDAQKAGQIAKRPRGEHGFGWNAIFIPEGSDKTYAELPDHELKQYSHRAVAVAKLRQFLEQPTKQ